jgi:hypothetical protein
MKEFFNLIITAFIIVTLAASCKKEKVNPLDKLPPATQEGKNTFGCLVNGEAWTPKGNNGTRNLYISYDPTRNNGAFTLSTYRITSNSNQGLTLFADNINYQKQFTFHPPVTSIILFDNYACYYDRDNNEYRKGTLTITKLDVSNQIIAGTFEAILAKPGCDTVRITDGRFDMRF